VLLIIQRTGQRRYGIVARRSPFPDLEMNPAPGYDPLLPHDLMHLVVEAQLGLKRAVFGQLAAGGDAGTFHTIFNPQERTRQAARLRNRVRARGKKLLHDGKAESAQSERAVYICRSQWLARLQSSTQRTATSPGPQRQRPAGPVTGLQALNEQKLDDICRHLDELSAHWQHLEVGQSMIVSWPELQVLSSESPHS